MKIESKLYTLKQIVEADKWQFSIPIYQRLYVWGKDQVETLLTDFANAYEDEECDIFFLGGTLTVERETSGKKHYELIDGQQRFTTLWILSHAWQEALKPYITFEDGDDTYTRVFFAIRDNINKFLSALAQGNSSEMSDEILRDTEQMRNAIARMESFISDRTKDRSDEERSEYVRGLTEFIYNKVQLVITQVSEQTDLNKLFEVINNRGVQLKHHEILKAKMLDVLTEEERPVYACLWEACSDMDGFIERNLVSLVGDLTGKELSGLFDKDQSERGAEKLRNASEVISMLKPKLENGGGDKALSLEDILSAPEKYKEYGEADLTADNDENGTWARSVIGFPMLLQHVLRIWLHKHGMSDLPKILDRELLVLFDEGFFAEVKGATKMSESEAVKSLIELLWEIRYLFDRYVIKWVNTSGEEEVQMVASMRLVDSQQRGTLSMNREKVEGSEARDLGMIQSFLYHSQEITTHYWLTPFLNYVHQHSGTVGDYVKYLRHLDNCMLGSDLEGSLADRSRRFLVAPWDVHTPRHGNSLVQSKGVHFWSYWFYKLEYVLWRGKSQIEGADKRWDDFRFTAKNSVEHISPQTPTEVDTNKVDEMLNYFGNLALVSRSVNSEYSNLPFNEKRQRFNNNNAQKLDSLKMAIIYKNEHWNDAIAKKHQDEMIDMMSNYFRENTKL